MGSTVRRDSVYITVTGIESRETELLFTVESKPPIHIAIFYGIQVPALFMKCTSLVLFSNVYVIINVVYTG